MNTTQAAIPGRSEAPRRLTALERRQAWARHRREAIRLVTAQVDWVPVLVFASILMSPEARIDLAGFQLYPYRLALIVSIPFMALRLAKEPIRLAVADILFFSSAALMFISTTLHYPLDVALKTGGATTLDTTLAYLLGRVFFRNPLDVRRFLYRSSPLVVLVGLIIFAESVSHQYIFRPTVGRITGFSPESTIERVYELRFGLLRAMGPFMHPIAAGIFFGSLVPLFLSADLPKRRWIGLIACSAGFFSWSSAGLATIILCFGLLFYDFVQKKYGLTWLPLLMASSLFLIVVEAFSGGGVIKFVIRYASINPQTGYFRLAIWDYGTAHLMRSPWIGIGILESYDRPEWMHSDSVDNYWLLLGLRFGIPCSVLMAGAFLFNIWKLATVRVAVELGSLRGRRMATGLSIGLAVIFLILWTVSPWGADITWLLILLGMAGGVSDLSSKDRGFRLHNLRKDNPLRIIFGK
ncbi:MULTISPECIES: O-antigen ligase family protein [Novosphingobium]|uniref:O-antigen ligase family protein n=1 Tax=Novosphingobium TaxID=165696 RepID=UPI0011AB54A8|nr:MULTISPECIES: O-antigen ligase family protein [Novosphingobium]